MDANADAPDAQRHAGAPELESDCSGAEDGNGSDSDEEGSVHVGPGKSHYKFFKTFGYYWAPKDEFDRLSDLPDEILGKIFDLTRLPGLLEFEAGTPPSCGAPISKRLLPFTQSALYSTVQFREFKGMSQFLQTITNRPDLAAMVFNLSITAEKGSEYPGRLEQSLCERALDRLPNLRRLKTYRGLERTLVEAAAAVEGVPGGPWLATPRPALQHVELTRTFRADSDKDEWIHEQPSLVSLSIPFEARATKWPQSLLATPDVSTATLPTKIKTLELEVRYTHRPTEKDRFIEKIKEPMERLLAHVVHLRLVDQDTNNIAPTGFNMPDEFFPPTHHCLLSTNSNLLSLDILTADPAYERGNGGALLCPEGELSSEDPSSSYEEWYADDSMLVRSRFALNDVLTRFSLLTSLSLDGAAVDDRDFTFLGSLPRLQRLSFGPFFDIRLALVASIIGSRAYPPALRELAIFVNRPFTSRPMWTGRRNLVDARRLLEAVEGTPVRIGGDLRGGVDYQERLDERESDSDDSMEGDETE